MATPAPVPPAAAAAVPTPAWPDVDAALLATLPPVLRGVVRALGFLRAQEWLQAFGGVPVGIPKFHSTTLGLTDEELGRLQVTLAPHLDAAGRVSLPKVDKLFLRLRDEEIRRQRPTGTLTGLARAHGLTSRHIQNICRETEDGQTSLF